MSDVSFKSLALLGFYFINHCPVNGFVLNVGAGRVPARMCQDKSGRGQGPPLRLIIEETKTIALFCF
jgi:hypothetical protein